MCENVSNKKKKKDLANTMWLGSPFSPNENQNPNHLFRCSAITMKKPSEILIVMWRRLWMSIISTQCLLSAQTLKKMLFFHSTSNCAQRTLLQVLIKGLKIIYYFVYFKS